MKEFLCKIFFSKHKLLPCYGLAQYTSGERTIYLTSLTFTLVRIYTCYFLYAETINTRRKLYIYIYIHTDITEH